MPPPYKIIDLFKAVGVNADVELQSIHQDVSLAEGISEGITLDIDGLIQSFECVMQQTKALQAFQEVHMQKLQAFKTKNSATTNTLQLVTQRTRPVENMQSAEYLDEVTDQLDIDHVEYAEDEVLIFKKIFFHVLLHIL